MTPTARSLHYLRGRGYHAFVTERWNPYAKIRQDLGGFADIVAWAAPRNALAGLAPGMPWVGFVAVQATTTGHLSHRADKIGGLVPNPAAVDWIGAGGRLILMGWSLKGPRGKRKTWALTQWHGRVAGDLLTFVPGVEP